MLDKRLWQTAAFYLVLMMAGCAPLRPHLDLSGESREPPPAELPVADIQEGAESSDETPFDILAGEEIVTIAQQYVGVPYLAGGATPLGFDCSGLVYYAYRLAGIAIPRTSREQFRFFQPVDRTALLPGDLLFFRLQRQKISHVGIFVKGSLFLHAPSPGKSVSYASLENPFWHRRFAGAGRLDKDEENK